MEHQLYQKRSQWGNELWKINTITFKQSFKDNRIRSKQFSTLVASKMEGRDKEERACCSANWIDSRESTVSEHNWTMASFDGACKQTKNEQWMF